MLSDQFGRSISYLRLAVTDRCNLRCQYCMPAEGIDIVNRKELLSYKEMYRITRVLSELGVNKVRLTGGEPFVRKDFISFLEMLSFNKKLKQINITTNGALISNYIDQLEQINVTGINLSLDTLQKDRFKQITRRDLFSKTMDAYDALLQSKLNLKLNVVVQSGFNTDEIVPFIELTQYQDIEIRFIEEMPFNGIGQRNTKEAWNYNRILKEASSHFKDYVALNTAASATANLFKVKGFKGKFGIIPAFTRTICHDCNRIRITATGLFKNCLFDDGVFNIRDFIRSDVSDEQLKTIFINTIKKKPKDGFVAEALRKENKVSESMSTIGG